MTEQVLLSEHRYFATGEVGNTLFLKALFITKIYCKLWEFKSLIDLLLPLLPLHIARDHHLAGSGWWVDCVLPGGELAQGVCAMVSCSLPCCSHSASEGLPVRPQDKG